MFYIDKFGRSIREKALHSKQINSNVTHDNIWDNKRRQSANTENSSIIPKVKKMTVSVFLPD